MLVPERYTHNSKPWRSSPSLFSVNLVLGYKAAVSVYLCVTNAALKLDCRWRLV